jgi:hypothetical protein
MRKERKQEKGLRPVNSLVAIQQLTILGELRQDQGRGQRWGQWPLLPICKDVFILNTHICTLTHYLNVNMVSCKLILTYSQFSLVLALSMQTKKESMNSYGALWSSVYQCILVDSRIKSSHS